MTTFALAIGFAEPIGEWRSLVNSIRAWLNRDDLSDDQITEFIALAEAEFNRVLRTPDMHEIATATLDTGNNDLPADLLSIDCLYLSGAELAQTTPTALAAKWGTVEGTPCEYTIFGNNPRKIRLGPQPETPVTVTLVYYKKIPSVDINNADNWLLNEHPDIYLYGSLLRAEAYLVNDERVDGWRVALADALDQLISASRRDRWSGGPLKPSGFPEIDTFDQSVT